MYVTRRARDAFIELSSRLACFAKNGEKFFFKFRTF
ncbi:hypothetical protein T4A_14133 [Trichinella pseudospiralis]|uniref:Uncharacterized protein n=1 Tax=Trichinella pseudospiralis TaxID=6337 RepID=A0A0V1DQT7_TRIPS|nr:hypothetical protein T4A_14133 [Trichinella pseudospiralis]